MVNMAQNITDTTKTIGLACLTLGEGQRLITTMEVTHANPQIAQPNISRALKRFVSEGFLTKAASRGFYRLVPGKEDEFRKRVTQADVETRFKFPDPDAVNLPLTVKLLSNPEDPLSPKTLTLVNIPNLIFQAALRDEATYEKTLLWLQQYAEGMLSILEKVRSNSQEFYAVDAEPITAFNDLFKKLELFDADND